MVKNGVIKVAEETLSRETLSPSYGRCHERHRQLMEYARGCVTQLNACRRAMIADGDLS